jgi:valyl-tRNA synthetase
VVLVGFVAVLHARLAGGDARHGALLPHRHARNGYDILFFWVARETMLSLALLGKAPYHTVYLHGLIRNEHGEKISKSMPDAWKYDPLYIIEEYGTDALRYTLTTSSSPGNDMNLDPRRLEGARNFANKLWQVTRFILMNVADADLSGLGNLAGLKLELEDRWILSRLHRLTGDVFLLMEDHQYGEAGRRVRDFLWDEFCDWYIEAAKVRLHGAVGDKAAPCAVLLTVLETALRLLHPFMPFVTEAIWQALPPSARSSDALIIAPWPQADTAYLDDAAEAQMALLMELVRGIATCAPSTTWNPASASRRRWRRGGRRRRWNPAATCSRCWPAWTATGWTSWRAQNRWRSRRRWWWATRRRTCRWPGWWTLTRNARVCRRRSMDWKDASPAVGAAGRRLRAESASSRGGR